MGFLEFRKRHPFDWIGHLIICFIVTYFLRLECGIVCALTIEFTQIEAGIWQKWDHLIDLVFGGIGILIAYLLIQ